MGSQDIDSPRGSIGPEEVRNDQSFDTSINGFSTEHRDPAPSFSKVISRKLYEKSRSDVYLHCLMNFTHDAVLIKSLNFMNLGISSVHALDALGSFSILASRIGSSGNGSNCLPPGHIIGEVTADRISRTGSEQKYSSKADFETRGGN